MLQVLMYRLCDRAEFGSCADACYLWDHMHTCGRPCYASALCIELEQITYCKAVELTMRVNIGIQVFTHYQLLHADETSGIIGVFSVTPTSQLKFDFPCVTGHGKLEIRVARSCNGTRKETNEPL